MKTMTLTSFRKNIYKTTNELKKGEKMKLTLKGEVVLTITKQVTKED